MIALFCATNLFAQRAAPTREPATPQTGKLTLNIHNEEGRPIAGTTATLQAAWMDMTDRTGREGQTRMTLQPGAPRAGKSDQKGVLEIPASSVFSARQRETVKTTLLVINELQKLGALIDVLPTDVEAPVDVTLVPLCFVHGKVDSPDMEAQGHVLKRITAYIRPDPSKLPLFECMSENQRFGMLVPPGNYEIAIGGVAVDGATYSRITTPVEIEKGRSDLDLETLHFESSKMSEMLGKPAPELAGIIEWKNGDPVTLAQLKGKVVVLDFWAWSCSICIAHMPELIAVQKQLKNDDLVIIAVHAPNATNLEEAYEKCAKARAKVWPKGELPFRVALDSPRGTLSTFGISGVPNLLVIDRDGNLARRFYHAGETDFKDEIVKLLKSRPKGDATPPAPTTTLATTAPTTKPTPPNPALATPESALRAYLNVRKKGDIAGYEKVVSKRLREAMTGAIHDSASPFKLDPAEFFAKLTITESTTDGDVALINAKVVYNKKWLEAHNKDLNAIETPAGTPAGVLEFKLDPDRGDLQWEDPIATKGEGFAAFVFMKEADGWRFHLGYMSGKPGNLKKVSDAYGLKTSPIKN